MHSAHSAAHRSNRRWARPWLRYCPLLLPPPLEARLQQRTPESTADTARSKINGAVDCEGARLAVAERGARQFPRLQLPSRAARHPQSKIGITRRHQREHEHDVAQQRLMNGEGVPQSSARRHTAHQLGAMIGNSELAKRLAAARHRLSWPVCRASAGDQTQSLSPHKRQRY